MTPEGNRSTNNSPVQLRVIATWEAAHFVVNLRHCELGGGGQTEPSITSWPLYLTMESSTAVNCKYRECYFKTLHFSSGCVCYLHILSTVYPAIDCQQQMLHSGKAQTSILFSVLTL